MTCVAYVSEESAAEDMDEFQAGSRQFDGTGVVVVVVVGCSRYDWTMVVRGRQQITTVVKRRQRVGRVRADVARMSRGRQQGGR